VRSRLLPAHVVVYYVLALNLFFGDAYEEVMRRLVAGLQFLRNWEATWKIPTTSALSQARDRLGEEPLRWPHERGAVPLPGQRITGARFAGLNVMAIDGVVFDVPDTAANAAEFGRTGPVGQQGPFPQIRVVGLGQCGTHAIVAARLGLVTTNEGHLAAELVAAEFDADMLVLADRGFYSYNLWHDALDAGAQLLWRVNANVSMPVRTVLSDGSYLSYMIDTRSRRRMRYLNAEQPEQLIVAEGTVVRVIEYQVEGRATNGDMYCLITTLLDPDKASAIELAAVYHRRWDFEPALDEIAVHQTGQYRVLRSKSPRMVRQKIWSLLLPLRHPPPHETSRGHHRIRRRTHILHAQRPGNPTSGQRPDRIFPLTTSPTHSTKPSPK
jgi:hypothetical protein